MNNKMQTFRTQLFQSAEVFDPRAQALKQVTELSPAQMLDASKGLEDWGVWGGAPATIKA
jgi:hypothetical protein